MKLTSSLLLGGAAALLGLFSACNDHGHDHETPTENGGGGKRHVHTAPHGGHLIELGDHFVFMGNTDAPRQAMRDADIYLSTSISEGLPLSLLEAMSEGRPVVATNVGGCADAVNGCGVLVNAGDAFGIAHGLGFLLENPKIGEMMGRRGFQRVGRRFSSEDQLSSYNSMFEAVAG